MNASQRDRRIRIEAIGPAVDDGVRTKPGGWLKLYDRWSQLMPDIGSERASAGEVAGVGRRRFRFLKSRSQRLPTSADRLVYPIDGQIHDIIDVVLVDRDAVEVTCLVRIDADPDGQADG